jgi:hypothetical protein
MPGPSRFQVARLWQEGCEDGRAIAYRSFACYPSWDVALPILSKHKHWDEIVVSGQPCKGFLDLDGDTIPEG